MGKSMVELLQEQLKDGASRPAGYVQDEAPPTPVKPSRAGEYGRLPQYPQRGTADPSGA